jgi:signal transduction histidine kinase
MGDLQSDGTLVGVVTGAGGEVADPVPDTRMRLAASAVASSTSLETLSRPFLQLVHKITGLESTYLTEVQEAAGKQRILFSDNRGGITIPEGLSVPWHDTLCRRSLVSGRRSSSDVPTHFPGSRAAQDLGLRSYVSVPVLGSDDQLLGTLCGASGQSTEVSSEALEVMGLLARLIADQWERDRLQKAAVLRAETAEATLRERAMFLAVAEHKLKSPLALLRGWTDLLAANWEELPPQVRGEAVRTMQEAARDAVRQVNEMLDEARGAVLSTQLQPVRVDVNDLVQQVARQLQGAATTSHQVVAQTNNAAVISADREALWQVLWHLGENAVKYSPEGGRIELCVQSIDPTVEVAVRDEGIGVPDELDVFAPFTRGTSDEHAGIEGSGLGLHIVRTLIHAMGGTVTAERQAERGSVFRLTLPRVA